MQITTHNSWTRLVWLGCLAFVGLASAAQAQTQTYYYYPAQTTPVYYRTGSFRGQTVWYNYPAQYYQPTYSTPVYQSTYAPQYYQTVQYDTNPQAVTYASQPQVANPAPVVQTAEAPQAEQAAVSAGDPYGFLNWLNATRASYGLSAVGHDPNLSSWAAMNNNQQASSGIGHFVMGPARRQNSAMGGFPGIESMWMASPAHRAALLDPTIRWIGIAGLGAYWTFNAY